MKKANALKEKLFSKINKNFKKHQNDFLAFVEKEEKCFKKNGKHCPKDAGSPNELLS